MAELDTSDSGAKKKHKGKVKGKKMSTRVDLTPMVDLAFLLITFFMLTTTLNKPQAMELNMPKKDDEDKTDIKESQVMTVLLDSLDQIWYYDGQTVADLKTTTFAGDAGIRKIILKKQKKVKRTLGEKKDLIVIIKLLQGAKYKAMVDILDEMDITDTKTYAILDPYPLEIEAIENGGNPKLATE